jgi:cytochrome c biogenesis protein CcdA
MNEEQNDRVLLNSVILVLGVLILLVGLLTTYTKMAGTRWGEVVEGIFPQVGGLIFICFGLYLIITSIRKLIRKNRKTA